MESVTERDSPLSITSSVAGILTFLVALLAAAYVRVSYLRNADEEYVRVKASLSWYKTESAWLSELAAATTASSSSAAAAAAAARAAAAATNTAFAAANIGDEILAGARKFETEYQMYAFVMDDLARLETRLLELVAETELKAEAGSSGNVGEKAMGSGGEDGRFGLVRRGTALGTSAAKRWWQWLWAGSGRSTVLPTSVAMAWLPVRAKALELVRQRDALTARVLFTQMSMVSS